MELVDSASDPDLAQVMGFSGFGNQPGMKRKFNPSDDVVDPGSKASEPNTLKTGANQITLGGQPGAASTSAGQQSALNHAAIARQHSTRQSDAASDAAEPVSKGEQQNDKHTLQALRAGVRNKDGDATYYLPSFLENPWKDLDPVSMKS